LNKTTKRENNVIKVIIKEKLLVELIELCE